MVKPLVFVTRKVPSPGVEILKEYCEVKVWESEVPPTREELVKEIEEVHGIFCMVTDVIDGGVMDSAPNLRVVSTMSVGYDHIDVPEATKRGIYVTNTPGVLTDATADLTWALLLAAARLVVNADRYVREGGWKGGWSPTLFLGESVYGKTLGIVGIGRIGSAVALRASGFGMKKLYFDVRRLPKEREEELGVEYRPLEDLLKGADFVTLHVPLTKETHHMIGEAQLRLMKPSAILVNASRGPVVDEAALVKALREGWIAGAALDVFEREPISPDNPLLKLGNVVLTPHIGSATKEARSKMAEMAAKNLISVLKGEAPPNLVNEEVQEVAPLPKVKVI